METERWVHEPRTGSLAGGWREDHRAAPSEPPGKHPVSMVKPGGELCHSSCRKLILTLHMV